MKRSLKTLGELVRWARYEKAFSMSYVAKLSDLNLKTVSRIEHGGNPCNVTIRKISRALDLPLNDLLSAKNRSNATDDAVALALNPINEELIKYFAKNPDKIHLLSPRNFEYLIADLLKDMGGEIEVTPETRASRTGRIFNNCRLQFNNC